MKKVALLLVSTAAVAAAVIGSSSGCSSNSDPYKPQPAWSGRKANVPSVPAVPTIQIKDGDAFTVKGAIHHLNSVLHNPDVTSKEITIEGYIVDMNTTRAPKCAIHKTGKADPEDCKWADGKPLQIPTIWIADGKTDEKPRIRVMGFASNYAQLYDAWQKYKSLKEPPPEKDQVMDELWAVHPPFPLPTVGAKIKVTGKYGVNFQRSSAGIESDPQNGIMTYSKIEYVEPPPEPFDFPQLKGK